MSDHYLLREDGGKILREDGGGILLDPTETLGDLTFLPIYPDRIPPLRFPHSKHWAEEAAVFVPRTIPIPDILATQRFLPTFPDRIEPRKTPRELIEATSGALTTVGVLVPTAWFPIFPDHPTPVHATPIRQGVTDATPSFIDLITASVMAWQSSFPDRIPVWRGLRSDPSGYRTFPPFIAASVTCVQLGLEGVTVTGLLADAVTTTNLIGEGVALTGLIAETLC